MSTGDRPDLREYPPLIEALTEKSELTGEPFDELMAQNPPNDPAANQESHMDRVRAVQRPAKLIGLRLRFVHYRDLPDKAPIEEAEFAEVKRWMAELEDEMRAAGQEP